MFWMVAGTLLLLLLVGVLLWDRGHTLNPDKTGMRRMGSLGRSLDVPGWAN